MGSEYTPGPWTFTDDGAWVEADQLYGKMAIANITGYCMAHGVKRIDNARLIAAAPDLLAVCEKVVEASRLSGVTGPLAEAARSALARAKGPSHD